MKKTISPLLGTGLLIYALLTVIERFVTPIPDLIAIPLIIVAIILIFFGGLKTKDKK